MMLHCLPHLFCTYPRVNSFDLNWNLIIVEHSSLLPSSTLIDASHFHKMFNNYAFYSLSFDVLLNLGCRNKDMQYETLDSDNNIPSRVRKMLNKL